MLKRPEHTTIQVITYGSESYHQLVELRNHILRKPLGLSFGPAELAAEKEYLFLGAFEENVLLGCCLLSRVDDKIVKLRQMAVREDAQGQGIGTSLLDFAEKTALEKGYAKLVMHARQTALEFYEKSGYYRKGEMFMEVGILHCRMEKELRP